MTDHAESALIYHDGASQTPRPHPCRTKVSLFQLWADVLLRRSTAFDWADGSHPMCR
jgi:hypothetical protein